MGLLDSAGVSYLLGLIKGTLLYILIVRLMLYPVLHGEQQMRLSHGQVQLNKGVNHDTDYSIFLHRF